MIIKTKIQFRMYVATVAMTLVLGWLSGSISLASWEPDVCEMECCIAEGHCCCPTRHAYVKGREPKPGEVRLETKTELGASCPAKCASSTTTARNHSSRAMHAPPLLLNTLTVRLPRWWDRMPLVYSFAAEPSSPRAPPICSKLAA
jgi:hypothetical protein